MPTLLLPAVQYVLNALRQVTGVRDTRLAIVLPEGTDSLTHQVDGPVRDGSSGVFPTPANAFIVQPLEIRAGNVRVGPSDSFGIFVAAGDVTGDGMDDVIIDPALVGAAKSFRLNNVIMPRRRRFSCLVAA